MAWTQRTELHHSLWASCGELNLLCKNALKLWAVVAYVKAAAACTLHSGFTGSEIRVCKCPYASSPSTVSEDSRAGKRLRLILVLRATNVESGPAESSTTTLIEGFFTLGMMPFNGSLRCSMIGLKRRRRISLKMAARHCVSLTKVSHEASSQKFNSVKSSLSLLKERLLPVSPKVRAEHCDQHLILRFTRQLKKKKKKKRSRGGWRGWAAGM